MNKKLSSDQGKTKKKVIKPPIKRRTKVNGGLRIMMIDELISEKKFIISDFIEFNKIDN